MSDEPFVKCPCDNCGGSIEFPGQGVGLKIECPHCGQRTLLVGPNSQPATAPPRTGPQGNTPADSQPMPEPQPESAKPKTLLPIAILLVIAALAGGAIWYSKGRPGRERDDAGSAKVPASNPSKATPTRVTNEPASTDAAIPTETPTTDKSIDDLKPSAVILEKAKSGSLMYAVGTVKNESPHQRFGVKVEIELTDAQGRPAGKATDYTQVIEPRQEWRFRALVLDAKAASGRVVAVKEDN
jgi:hypothetical protein